MKDLMISAQLLALPKMEDYHFCSLSMLNLYIVWLNTLAFSNAKQSENPFDSMPPDKEKGKSNLWSACYPFAFNDVYIGTIHR